MKLVDWAGNYSCGVDSCPAGYDGLHPPPTGIVAHATATGLDAAWSAATGPYIDTIDRYQIIIWDGDTPGAYIEGTAVKGAVSAHRRAGDRPPLPSLAGDLERRRPRFPRYGGTVTIGA